MKFKELRLYTHKLSEQKEFYLNKIGFELLEEHENEICFKVGWTKLRFIKSETQHEYHYCFLIPSNKLNDALKWINKKVKTEEVEVNQKIVFFEDWNAHSFYFYDGGGNIAEFIVRHDLNNEVNEEFNEKMVLCVNEIGIGTDDIEKINSHLEKNIGTKFYKGNLNRFGTNGSLEGIFLIPNYNLKETWFPTEMKIKPEPFESIVQNNGKDFFVKYKNGEISTKIFTN